MFATSQAAGKPTSKVPTSRLISAPTQVSARQVGMGARIRVGEAVCFPGTRHRLPVHRMQSPVTVTLRYPLSLRVAVGIPFSLRTPFSKHQCDLG